MAKKFHLTIGHDPSSGSRVTAGARKRRPQDPPPAIVKVVTSPGPKINLLSALKRADTKSPRVPTCPGCGKRDRMALLPAFGWLCTRCHVVAGKTGGRRYVRIEGTKAATTGVAASILVSASGVQRPTRQDRFTRGLAKLGMKIFPTD